VVRAISGARIGRQISITLENMEKGIRKQAHLANFDIGVLTSQHKPLSHAVQSIGRGRNIEKGKGCEKAADARTMEAMIHQRW
jgi:hypothetical protein